MWKRYPSTRKLGFWAIVMIFSQNEAKIALKMNQNPVRVIMWRSNSPNRQYCRAQQLGKVWRWSEHSKWTNEGISMYFSTVFGSTIIAKKRWPPLQRAGSQSSGGIFVWDFFIPLVQSEFYQEIIKAWLEHQYAGTGARRRSNIPLSRSLFNNPVHI